MRTFSFTPPPRSAVATIVEEYWPGAAPLGTETVVLNDFWALRAAVADDGSLSHFAGMVLTPLASGPASTVKVTLDVPLAIFGAPHSTNDCDADWPGARSSSAQLGWYASVVSTPLASWTAGVNTTTPVVLARIASGTNSRPAPVPVTPTAGLGSTLRFGNRSLGSIPSRFDLIDDVRPVIGPSKAVPWAVLAIAAFTT